MMTDKEGFRVTPSRVSFALGLIALITVVWQGISYTKAQEFRVTAVEVAVQRNDRLYEKLAEQMDKLSAAVTELSVVIREVEKNR